MKEIPLYGGPSLRTAKADPGTAARAANGDQGQMLGGSIQMAEQNLQGSAEAFARISDFGEMQRQEAELRRIRDESDAEFSRMLAYAPGTKDSVFNNDGAIIQGRLDDLAFKFGQRIESLGGTFFSPEIAMKARGVKEGVKASLPERYRGLAAKHQLSVARQAFETNLKLAEEKGDWGGYESSVMGGVQSQVISPAEGELRLLRGRKKASLQNFKNLAATNPDLAAEMINRGELDGYFSAAEQEQMMRSLRSHDDDRLTELINQAVSQPRGRDNRQAMASALLAGSPYEDELKFLSVYNRDQSFAACMPEIENFLHRLADDVAPGEEKDVLESKMTDLSRKCTFYQMPSDTKSRLLKRMEENAKRRAEYPKLNAVEYIKNATAGRNVKLYDPALYNERTAGLRQQAIESYMLLKDTVQAAGLSDLGKKKFLREYINKHAEGLQEALNNQTVSKVRIAFDAWHDAYKQDHGDKEPSITIQEDKLETLLRQYTGNQNFSLPGKFGMEADNVVNKANKAAKDAYLQRKESAPKLADDQAKERLIPQKTFTFPATLSVDTVQTNAPAGILLPESMRKRFGDDLSHVAALVPVSSSSRRGRPLPIVGFTKASSPQLTLAGASKLRMTFSSRMNTHVSIVPVGKEMQEFFKREFFNQPSGDSEALPLDYGLVPDNGVETAEPVSGTYLNGELTMLPPLN